jgi:hypothetical protein
MANYIDSTATKICQQTKTGAKSGHKEIGKRQSTTINLIRSERCIESSKVLLRIIIGTVYALLI